MRILDLCQGCGREIADGDIARVFIDPEPASVWHDRCHQNWYANAMRRANDPNLVILERIRGVSAQRGTSDSDADPRNPNNVTLGTHFKCEARAGGVGANDPQECNWPICGCDEYATKVIGALQEMGLM